MGTTLTDEMVEAVWTKIGKSDWSDSLYSSTATWTCPPVGEWIKGRSKTIWTKPAIRKLIRLNPGILFK